MPKLVDNVRETRSVNQEWINPETGNIGNMTQNEEKPNKNHKAKPKGFKLHTLHGDDRILLSVKGKLTHHVCRRNLYFYIPSLSTYV